MKKRFTCFTVLFIWAFLLLIPIQVPGAVTAPEYTFTTLDDTTITTNGTGYQATVLVFGYTTCGTTGYELSNISKSEWVKSPNIRVVFVETSKASKEEVAAFLEKYECSGITACYDTESFDMFYALAEYTELFTGVSGSMTVPTTVLIDGENNIQNLFQSGAVSADDIIIAINAFVDTGYTTANPYYNMSTNLIISGTEDYTSANAVYQLVNQARTANGLSNLHMDKELTETAMQRAAEIAVYYSHMRPDGSECFSVFPNPNVCAAENIAVGYRDADSVMEGWLNSSGHYANIMDTDMKNIGIGCFVDDRGTCYWVQCFDGDTEYTEETKTNQTVSRTILIKSEFISLYAIPKTTYKCSDTTVETQMTVRNINTEFGYSMPAIDVSNLTFSTNNPAVASVDASGKITIQGIGTADITATLNGDIPLSVTQTIEKKDHQTVTTATKSYCSSCDTVFWEKPLDNTSDVNNAGNENSAQNQQKDKNNASGENSKPKNSTVSLKKPKIKSINAKKKSMVVSWKKDKNASGYEIRYSLKSNFSSPKKVKINKNTTTKKTIKKLKKGKRYYVSIRSYKQVKVNGKTKKVYSAWSNKMRSAKIK